MKLARLRLNPDGRTVSRVDRMRPVSCPPPTTAEQVYDAGQALLAEAATILVVVTREGTARHQAAVGLEHARLLHHVERTEWAATFHAWEITELGRFEFETSQGQEARKS